MNQSILLDTCAMIWMEGADKLSKEAVAAIDAASDQADQLVLSPISAWEIGMLASKGRLALTMAPQVWFDRFTTGANVRLSPLSPEVLIASSYLPGAPPNDPIDRIIIATARQDDLTLITRDKAILAYGRTGHVCVIEC